MKLRQRKKQRQLNHDLQLLSEWFIDYRGYLLEAIHENVDLRIIDQQFKKRMLRKGNYNRYFKRTQMNRYRKEAIG